MITHPSLPGRRAFTGSALSIVCLLTAGLTAGQIRTVSRRQGSQLPDLQRSGGPLRDRLSDQGLAAAVDGRLEPRRVHQQGWPNPGRRSCEADRAADAGRKSRSWRMAKSPRAQGRAAEGQGFQTEQARDQGRPRSADPVLTRRIGAGGRGPGLDSGGPGPVPPQRGHPGEAGIQIRIDHRPHDSAVQDSGRPPGPQCDPVSDRLAEWRSPPRRRVRITLCPERRRVSRTAHESCAVRRDPRCRAVFSGPGRARRSREEFPRPDPPPPRVRRLACPMVIRILETERARGIRASWQTWPAWANRRDRRSSNRLTSRSSPGPRRSTKTARRTFKNTIPSPGACLPASPG